VELLSDPGYKRSFVPHTNSFTGTVKEIYPYLSVWVWSRSLSIANIKSFANGSIEYDHKLVNITPYISSLNFLNNNLMLSLYNSFI